MLVVAIWCVWGSKVPKKVAFLVATAALGKIFNVAYLLNIILFWLTGVACLRANVNLWIIDCYISHLLMRCGPLCFLRLGFHWVMPKKLTDVLFCWKGCMASIVIVSFGMQVLIVLCGQAGESKTTNP